MKNKLSCPQGTDGLVWTAKMIAVIITVMWPVRNNTFACQTGV